MFCQQLKKTWPGEQYLHVKAREAGIHDKVSIVVALSLGDAVKKRRGFLTHHQFARNC